MNKHERACHDAKIAVKAYQNLDGALRGFDKLIALGQSNDAILLSSVFCFAVVKYSKPFVDTRTPHGKTRFPIGQLKAVPGFVAGIHEHLLELRNTLVAHDDLESIEPRILTFCMVTATGSRIPVSMAASNMCLAFPNTTTAIGNFRGHIAACVQGVSEKLLADLARIRQAALDDPTHALKSARYENNYGPANPVDGTKFQPPEFMNDEWLKTSQPSFAHTHNGFHYETLRVRRNFYGPEKIVLHNGETIEISPAQFDTNNP